MEYIELGIGELGYQTKIHIKMYNISPHRERQEYTLWLGHNYVASPPTPPPQNIPNGNGNYLKLKWYFKEKERRANPETASRTNSFGLRRINSLCLLFTCRLHFAE